MDRPKDEVQNVEDKDVELVEIRLVGTGRQSQDELEVGELLELHDEYRLDGC
jgi:hypothetical protein